MLIPEPGLSLFAWPLAIALVFYFFYLAITWPGAAWAQNLSIIFYIPLE